MSDAERSSRIPSTLAGHRGTCRLFWQGGKPLTSRPYATSAEALAFALESDCERELNINLQKLLILLLDISY